MTDIIMKQHNRVMTSIDYMTSSPDKLLAFLLSLGPDVPSGFPRSVYNHLLVTIIYFVYGVAVNGLGGALRFINSFVFAFRCTK
jgi:hypothetical protein